MATVFRKTLTKPMPQGAELFTRKGERFARWTDGKGRTRQAKVTAGKDGSPRLLIEADTWTAKYRDGAGIVREVATGCRDELAARNVLADLVKRRELVKGKILTAAQDAVIDHQGTPIGEHVAAYIEHLTARGVTPGRIAQTESRLRRVFGDCSFDRLASLDATALERWLTARARLRMSAAARNAYRSACVAFGNWCVQSKRLVMNPLAGIPKVDDRGRTVDVHALRHTTGTHLSKGGVAPRTAQAVMRHSSIDLTMNTYTDPRLLDVAGALDALPDLPLNGRQDAQELRKTGTTGGPDALETTYEKPKSAAKARETEPADGRQRTYVPNPLAPTLAPTSYKSSKSGTIADKTAGRKAWASDRGGRAENPCNINAKRPLSSSDNGRRKQRAMGVEPTTTSLEGWSSSH